LGIFLLLGATTNAHIEHNTVLQSGTALLLCNAPEPGVVILNNLMMHNLYGVIGTGTGVGTASLVRYCPGYVFRGNALIGGDPRLYPPGNLCPASPQAAKITSVSDVGYGLAPDSLLKGAGTDGEDVGVNITALRVGIRHSALAGTGR
jgi:hypothetical protein